MVVLDASVVIKWFKPDEQSKEASFYLEQHESGKEIVFAPVLLRYEVINAFRYSKKLTKIELEKVVFLLGEAKLNYVFPDDALLSGALRVSLDCDVSMYDAAYVALAKSLRCPLVTADRRLCQKAKKEVQIIML